MPPGQVLESSNPYRSYWILKLLVATLKSEVWEQNCQWLFYYFNFERNCDLLKSQSPCILLNKNINFNWKTPHTVLERWTLYFSSYKNRQLKVKLWWVGTREKKKTAFFVPFILSKGNFLTSRVGIKKKILFPEKII